MRDVRIPLLVMAVVVVLAGCSSSEAEEAAPDPVCAEQAEDLADVRALAVRLSDPDSRWGPGGPEAAYATAGEALTALTGYMPGEERLAGVTDRAREAVQAFHDDLGDGVLTGTGQTADTAHAALDAIAEVCG